MSTPINDTDYLIRTLTTGLLGLCGGSVLVFALLHRLQLQTPDYESSPLIPALFVMMTVTIIMTLVYAAYAAFLFYRRRWSELVIISMNIVIGIGSLIAASIIDAPTVQDLI